MSSPAMLSAMQEIMGQHSLRAAWYSGVCPLWSNAGGAIGGAGEGRFPGKVHNTEVLSREVLSRSRSRLLEVSSSIQRWRCGASTLQHQMVWNGGVHMLWGSDYYVVARFYASITPTPIPCERSQARAVMRIAWFCGYARSDQVHVVPLGYWGTVPTSGSFLREVHNCKVSPGMCSSIASVASSRYSLASDGAVARRLDGAKRYRMERAHAFGGHIH